MKIPAIDKTRQYELTFLVPGDFTDGEYVKVKEDVTALIEKNKGKVDFQEDWGKKSLAYKLKRKGKLYTEAMYAHLVFSINAGKSTEIEKALLLNQDIMRHLLVLASDEKTAKEKEEVKE